MKSGGSVVAGTLGIAGALAALVAVAGVMMSRQVSYQRVAGGGGRAGEAFRELADRIDLLEVQWEEALRGRAEELLAGWPPRDGAGVGGLTGACLLDPERDRGDEGVVRWAGAGVMPELGKFSNGEDRWVLPDSVVGESGFRDERGRPPLYVWGNGRVAVVMVLDPKRAAEVARRELTVAEGPAGEGALMWLGPGEVEAGRSGVVPDRRADEIVRHVSRFGDWTLKEWYPVVERVNHRTPVLAGAFTLSGLIAAGGVALAAGQRKAMKLAAQQVSFVNRVSHELRTPLTNLLLNTDLALDSLGSGDDKARRRLGLIREETGRLSRIVDNVLAFARAGRDRPPSAGCDVGEVIEGVSAGFRPLFERKGMSCEIGCPEGLRSAADADTVAQILSNLLSNAEKHAGEGSRVRVSAERDPGGLVIEVHDDGPGIPKSFRRRLFTPFARASQAVEEGVSGTGLGLSISRELAERSGGGLEFMAADGGARFRVRLPAEEGRNA